MILDRSERYCHDAVIPRDWEGLVKGGLWRYVTENVEVCQHLLPVDRDVEHSAAQRGVEDLCELQRDPVAAIRDLIAVFEVPVALRPVWPLIDGQVDRR